MKEIKIKIKTGIAVFSINLWGNFNLLVTYRLLACLKIEEAISFSDALLKDGPLSLFFAGI